MGEGLAHRLVAARKLRGVEGEPVRRPAAPRIAGPYRRDDRVDPDDPNIRPVNWRGEVLRDLLSLASRNSLGAISTLFLLPPEVAEDVERALASQQPAEESSAGTGEVGESAADVFADIQSKATEFAKDRVSALGWDEMQELVAGLLRALGYKTRVSAAGPDRGKDIVASPDGFGFEAPRIVVEVKHRKEAMGSQEIRSFLGGRHPQDKGLYVSTGGFTKDAYYEAERANIPLALMTIDELVESVIENYDKLDMATKQLLPMKRVYWPA
ncbi:restriction endonuclease [Aurantimonas sp. VKM B-3413]|nr:restriction endonuclease [Aurantimonas sp. VKM B-3413]